MFVKIGLCLLAVALCLTVVNAQKITQECLGCICEASTGCNLNQRCQGNYCGPFLISWAYWADAKKPVAGRDHPEGDRAYPNCVNDVICSAATVSQYMANHAKDCDNDGQLTCADFARIHKLGPRNCEGVVNNEYWVKFQDCAAALNISTG
ncbi:lysozyme 1-like [Oratosquilla oratoria]|uniref:lysozyme 1-like n=1 Tax=Oratosquilla oratoria TaxID=337810 RepID=UPI003F7765D4